MAAAQSAFVKAMDSSSSNGNNCFGENGSLEYTLEGVKEARVALFFALVRDISKERLENLMDAVASNAEPDPNAAADLFLMAFQTRFCRGGKGERDLFYQMILKLFKTYPQTVEDLLCKVPKYGFYKDWFKLVDLAEKESSTDSSYVRIKNTIMNLAAEQLIKDRELLQKFEQEHGKGAKKPCTSLSLLAKWAPREKRLFKTQVSELANRVFPDSKAPKKEYRQLLSRLNKMINTTEVLMSANEWDLIDFNQVPSLCLMKNRKAFLNENGHSPEDEKRIACRKRLRDTMLESNVKKIKGKQLYPHEIVKKLMHGTHNLSTLELDLFSAQWDSIRSSVLESLEQQVRASEAAEEAEKGVDLGKVVPLVDVSGSMYGTPMEVAIALGILVSELSSPSFKSRCLTFSERPTWVSLDDAASLDKKVKKLMDAPWGMSTNFEEATERILEVAISNKLTPEEIPDLIVFSDMQFDQARNSRSSSWETHHERIVRRFKEAGMKICGREYPAPHIIYWNLRGSTSGFPAQADTENVTMLSGYSPSLLKLLLNGEPLQQEVSVIVGADGTEIKVGGKDPYLTVRAALDDEEYIEIRSVLYSSTEGALASYHAEENMMEDKVKGNSEEWEVI